MSLRFLSISQLSEVTGKDRRTISKRLAGQPHSTSGRAQVYDAPTVIELILSSDSVAGIDKQMAKAELGLEIARQAKAEIEVGKLRGELVSIEEVAKTVEKEYNFVRAQFRSIPSRLAKPLSMVTDPNEVHARLSEAVDECLTELTADAKYEHVERQLDAAKRTAEQMQNLGFSSDPETKSSGMGRPEEISQPGIEFDPRPVEDR